MNTNVHVLMHIHGRAVTAAAFHPNLPLAVTVSDDKFGILWNLTTCSKQWQVRSCQY